MLKKLHESHLGIEKTKKLAREFIFWPGINAEITDVVSKCSICLENRNSHTKEPMKISEIPDLPWKAVGTDLFHWNNNNYLMVVDYYSRYFEIAKLENTKATCVINHLKSIFARHGIPQYVRSDCGPQYTSAEFKKFSEEWGFTHQKSSPNYQQSNGLAERFVQSAKKNMLNKAHKEGKDPYLSMLAYRNTPIEDVGSPVQLLMNRRLRSTIPATNKKLRPKCVNLKTIREKIQNSKQKVLLRQKYKTIGVSEEKRYRQNST
ncbi:uncharacterized protein K02A2.6-like [Saccostrea cucullata]|uniref:uncharacterized protein K02A2.6-like n=1 Tax=Saccostrea cuccullata TaxID=36930 RepID=UPI002ED6C1AF